MYDERYTHAWRDIGRPLYLNFCFLCFFILLYALITLDRSIVEGDRDFPS